MSYILDCLVKYECHNCGGEFILSEYLCNTITDNEVTCPYCDSKEELEAIVYLNDEDRLRELGCMGIGHYELENSENVKE